ncbi:sporulation protein YjcZ [Metabacillus endolithicus]|nr:sporulation protein YjcZ [Metabacillus endolithicus]UPG65933.1 sporulation protein YjcZ [Metabacillus endolithicus]
MIVVLFILLIIIKISYL